MAFDIQAMFADLIPNQAAEDERRGAIAAQAYGDKGFGGTGMAALARTVASLTPERGTRVRQNLGSLTGIDTATDGEKLQRALKGADISTQAGQDAAFKLISEIDPNKALQFRAAMGESNRQQQAANAQTTAAEAAARNAATSEAQLPIQQLNAENETSRIVEIAVQNDIAREQQQLATEQFAFTKLDEARFRAIQEEQNAIERLRVEVMSSQMTNQDKTMIAEAVEESIQAQQTGVEAVGLASQYERLDPLAGVRGSAIEGFKSFLGTQDEVSLLKTDFTKFINASVVAGLPPGVASDKDIEMVKQGFPRANYNAEMIQRYMRGLAKISFIESARQSLKAQYVNDNNGNLAGFQAAWDELRNSEGFVEGLEEKHGVNFITEGEEDDIGSSLAARTRAAIVAKESQEPLGSAAATELSRTIPNLTL